MAKKSILITGGSGFIGRNLLESLGGEYDISAPSRTELDLLDSEAVMRYLKERGFDAVVHAANMGGTRKTKAHDNAGKNLRMFANMAECGRHFGKMIQLGSGAEYDKSRHLVRVREEEFGKRVPSDEYGRYKYECSKHIEKADNITCLRIFGCYGKYEDYEIKFISNAICKAVFGLPMTIAHQNVVFSYLYIDDFVKIVQHFIEHGGKHKFYNVTPNETVDLLSIAKKVNEVSGKNLPITVKLPGMGNEYSGGNARLKAEMPEMEFTSIDEGIARLYKWYQANAGMIDKNKLVVDRY